MQTEKKIERNDLKMLNDSDFWMQLHDDFQIHSNHIDELNGWTRTAMFVLHSKLLLNNGYQRALVRAENEIIINHNLVTSLFENDFLRVNLISIKKERALPMHDHPGSSGAMMVISGKVHAIAFEEEKSADNTQSSNILTITDSKIASVNETGCFTEDQYNIHSIKALTNRAVLMVIHTPPFAANQQTFFFTANPLQKVGSQILVQPVRAQASEKFRKNNIQGIVK
jgi:hypothetical protein